MDIVEILDRYSAGDEFQRPVEAAIEEIEQLRQRVAELEKENSIERNLRIGVEAVFDTLNEDIGRLKAERDELKAQWDYYQDFCKSHNANGITDLVVQRDAALAENAAYYQLAKKEVWASAENKLLAQAAVIEKLRVAYVALENFAQTVGGSSSFWEDMNDVLEPASCIANFNTDSTQILAEVRRAEREKCAEVCESHPDPEYTAVHFDCARLIRAME